MQVIWPPSQYRGGSSGSVEGVCGRSDPQLDYQGWSRKAVLAAPRCLPMVCFGPCTPFAHLRRAVAAI